MNCSQCHKELNKHAIYCSKCGVATDLLSTTLSAKNSCESVKKVQKELTKKNFKTNLFLLFVGFVLIASTVIFWDTLFLIPIYLIIFPFLLIPLTTEKGYIHSDLSIKAYFVLLSNYPKMFIFVLGNILYFYILHFVCTLEPLLAYSYDPILNLVELVMVFYWLATIIPAFGLIRYENVFPLKALFKSYKAGAETRWQQFFILVRILLFIFVSILTLGIYFLFKISYIYSIVEEYNKRMEKCELFKGIKG